MEGRAAQITAVMALFLGLSWIFVALRCWVRIKMTKSFAIDDWLTLASLVNSPSKVYMFLLRGMFDSQLTTIHSLGVIHNLRRIRLHGQSLGHRPAYGDTQATCYSIGHEGTL